MIKDICLILTVKAPISMSWGTKQQQKTPKKQEIRWCVINSWSFRGSVMGVSNKLRTWAGGVHLYLEWDTHEVRSMTSLTGRRCWSLSPWRWHVNWQGIGRDMGPRAVLYWGGLQSVNTQLTRSSESLELYHDFVAVRGQTGIIPEQQYEREEWEKQLATFLSIYRHQRQNVTCFHELICANKASAVSCCAKRLNQG